MFLNWSTPNRISQKTKIAQDETHTYILTCVFTCTSSPLTTRKKNTSLWIFYRDACATTRPKSTPFPNPRTESRTIPNWNHRIRRLHSDCAHRTTRHRRIPHRIPHHLHPRIVRDVVSRWLSPRGVMKFEMAFETSGDQRGPLSLADWWRAMGEKLKVIPLSLIRRFFVPDWTTRFVPSRARLGHSVCSRVVSTGAFIFVLCSTGIPCIQTQLGLGDMMIL